MLSRAAAWIKDMRTPRMIILWLVLVIGGFGYLINYTATAGRGDDGRPQWPQDAQLERPSDKPLLLMFVHPACPCSRASMEELSRLVARANRKVAVSVLFLRPDGFEAGWERSDLWESASRIPGVRVLVDPAGIAARRFGAATSGYTLLYDRNGRLVFRGGITASRGHEGDNVGKHAILSWLHDTEIESAETPVFGCPLFDE